MTDLNDLDLADRLARLREVRERAEARTDDDCDLMMEKRDNKENENV